MNDWSWLILHNFLNPIIQATADLSEPPVPIPLAKWPQAPALAAASLDSQLGFTWEAKPSTSSSHLRLLYSSGRVALAKTQVGVDLGMHHPGNPRASAPSGQLQNPSEYDHTAPAQWSQPVLAADWTR